MSIKVAGKDSPQPSRVAWFSIGVIITMIGLAMAVIPLLEVENLAGLAVSMILVAPGLLWISTGTRVILRVTGLRPLVRIGSSGVAAFTITATVGLVGAFATLFFWVLARSVWVNEGGTLATAPNDALIYTGACLVFTVICLALAFASSRVVDPPD